MINYLNLISYTSYNILHTYCIISYVYIYMRGKRYSLTWTAIFLFFCFPPSSPLKAPSGRVTTWGSVSWLTGIGLFPRAACFPQQPCVPLYMPLSNMLKGHYLLQRLWVRSSDFITKFVKAIVGTVPVCVLKITNNISVNVLSGRPNLSRIMDPKEFCSTLKWHSWGFSFFFLSAVGEENRGRKKKPVGKSNKAHKKKKM